MLLGVNVYSPDVPFIIVNVTGGTEQEKDKWKHFAYEVTIETINGRGYVQHTAECKKGSGHVGVCSRRGEKYVPEHGKSFPVFKWTQKTFKTVLDRSKLKPIPPDVEEIDDLLKGDCQAIRDNYTWQDFANCFGYNVDSIKDQQVYFACQKQYNDMREFLGRRFEAWLNSPSSDERSEQERDRLVAEHEQAMTFSDLPMCFFC